MYACSLNGEKEKKETLLGKNVELKNKSKFHLKYGLS